MIGGHKMVDNTIAIIWSVDDVFNVRPDLDTKQAINVLKRVKSSHDACIGINWDVLKDCADDLYPKGE